MSSKFVIGNREKKEWISVLDTDNKELVFTGNLAKAKEYLPTPLKRLLHNL